MKQSFNATDSRRCRRWVIAVMLFALVTECFHVIAAFSSIIRTAGLHVTPHYYSSNSRRARSIVLNNVAIWIEEGEDDFVDSEENLDEGEVCLRSLKAFAFNPDNPPEPRFLCAGALIQRPPATNNNSNSTPLQLFDAWIADSILDDGGPNLQTLGALQIIDTLFLDHLERFSEDPILALRSFLIQCPNDNDFTCASYQAMRDRGFRPMQSLVKNGKTIYNIQDYYYYDDDSTSIYCQQGGNLFHYKQGMERSKSLATASTTTDTLYY